MTSPTEAGNCASSSTETMCRTALSVFARAIAADTARPAPSEPSLATTMFLNIWGLAGFACLAPDRFERWHEPFLRDERGHHGTADHGGDQDCILLLIDDLVGEAEQRGNGSEGKPGG